MGEYVYQLNLTEKQARLLSYACDQFSRLICGQDWSFQELMEAAWEKRCKEAVGGYGMDKEWDGGWYNMREEAEAFAKNIKKRFWGMEWNAMYGVYYDETADILFDIHQVIRHQLWLDRPEGEKSHITVDASEAMKFGDEPLAQIVNIKPQEKGLSKIKVSELPVSVRIIRCFRRADIETLEDLLRLKKKALLEIRGFGNKCLTEIDDYIVSHGYTWGNESLVYIKDEKHPWLSDYRLPKK